MKHVALFLILFSFSLIAENPLLFKPDFSGKPIFMPQGTNIIPLCSDPSNPLCFSQWTKQAIPLANYLPNFKMPQYSYFLPSFISLGLSSMGLEDLENNDEWEEIYIPSVSSSRQRDRKNRFYRNKSDPNKIKRVQKKDDGSVRVEDGNAVFVSENDIDTQADDKENTKGAETENETPQDTKEVENSQDTEEQKLELKDTSLVTTTPLIHTLNKDTYALPADTSPTEEAKPGCFVINKQDIETEAGFCAECEKASGDNNLLSFFQDRDFISAIKKYLNKVTDSSQHKISQQSLQSDKSDTQKICSPELSLKAIIDNFNRTCPSPYNNFKDFFKKTHCDSCKKGVPSEIMLAMMSIESAGRCPALNDNPNETSTGLFQVNADEHSCRDENGKTYTKKSLENIQCLKNPVNNLNKSVEILIDHYGKTNSKPISQGNCKDWLSMTVEERDSWRRGVSAYNSGPGWLTRAIKSVRDPKISQGTKHLIGSEKGSSESYKDDKVGWEDLRMFYFVEKLVQNSKNLPACDNLFERDLGGSGRQLCLTVSNLAHTEAVLGREVKGSPLGIVEIWSQYKKNNPVICSE
ncbi:MAG: transglycosylase SLT domain-containing protein [Bdellovibrionaceae bacterium]|nr:transglycosylase SLT domain-containing protein [Pseudobdellovibrionaceae bacterium]